MKTYFVFLYLFILTAARQIHIKNLKEEKQEKLLHSSPISRPLKRNRRGAWGWFKKAVKWTEKAAKDTGKWTETAAKDTGKWTETAAKDTGKWTETAAKDTAKWTEKAAKDTAKVAVEAFEDGVEWAGDAIDDLIDLVECVAGVEFGCIAEIHEQNTQCIQRNECIFEYGKKCIDIPKQTLTFSEWALPNKLKVEGSLAIDLDVSVAIDPKDVKFSVDVKAIVTNEFDLIMSDGSGYEKEKEKTLATKRTIFKKVFMAGTVPILIEVAVVPMAWVNFDTNASFEAVMKVSGEMSFSQKLTVDVDHGTVTTSNGKPSGTPFNVDSLTVTGNFNANASIRVGPRIIISVNKVPAILDVAAKLGASMELSYVKTFRHTTDTLSRYRPIDRFTKNREFMPQRNLLNKIPQSSTQLSLRHQNKSKSLSITRSRSTGRNNGGHKWNTRGRRTSSCTDSSQACANWARLNYCTQHLYVDWMAEHCRQSCKICTNQSIYNKCKHNDCMCGKISIEAAANVRVGMELSALNPIELARQACKEAVAILGDLMNPMKHLARTADCFADAIGVDISVVTEPVQSFDVSGFTSKICNEAIDIIVPNEWERFACQVTEAINTSSDWTTIISYKPTLKVQFCPETEIGDASIGFVFDSKSSSCP